MSDEVQAAVVLGGAALLFVDGGAIWQAATMRGDVHARWARRVKFAIASLDEKLTAELRELREEINGFLPGQGGFDPAQAIADPTILGQRVSAISKVYRARSRMNDDLVRTRRLGPVLIALLSILAVSIAALTSHYGELLRGDLLRMGGLILLAISGLGLVAMAGAHAILQHRLVSAEILAGTAEEAAEE